MGRKLRWKAIIGWGAAVYAAMFLLWSFFVKYGFVEGFLPNTIGVTLLILVLIIAARSLHFSSWQDILPYSVGWAIIVAILDILLTVPFTGWAIFAHPRVLLGYTLILLVPLAFFERAPLASKEVELMHN